MSAPTVSGPLDGSDFAGKSKSFAVLPGGRNWPTCKSCGSTLYPSRQESSEVRTISGSKLSVEKYRSRCGTGREVPRPLEAGLSTTRTRLRGAVSASRSAPRQSSADAIGERAGKRAATIKAAG